MVYSGGFAVGVSVDGEFLEERKDGQIIVPLNSEYSVRLLNKNNRRAVGKIFLDGENVSDNGYIIPAYSHIDIERWASIAKRFKFVDLHSEEAVRAGKSGPNEDGSKGLVECHFWLEKVYEPTFYQKEWAKGWQPSLKWSTKDNTAEYIPTYNSHTDASKGILRTCSVGCNTVEGVTVKGGHSNQHFSSAYVNLDHSNCIIMKLVLMGGEPKPKVVYCADCGAKKPKKNAKYCYQCGHSLN